jgi:gamma-glutamyltranspeptidase/glutathione hydrolase
MHPLASDAALQVLREGGNAVDAAIALGAVISVTSHDWAGIAGDSAWLSYNAQGGEFHHLDGYSTCPALARPERIQEHFGLDRNLDSRAFQEEPPDTRHIGVITGMVPGTPAAWGELSRRFGSMPFERLLEPAVDLARRGFAINEYFAGTLRCHAKKVRRFRSSARILCDEDGVVLHEGATFKQPDLADTLDRLAKHGHAGFYRGTTADMIVQHCRREGAMIGHADLQEYRAKWRNIVAGTYRGFGVVVTSPPTAGLHVIQALNLLEGFDLGSMPYHGADSLHLLIEAVRLALRSRREIGGDPDQRAIDIASFASKAFADRHRDTIDTEHSSVARAESPLGTGTTHFCVVDVHRNVVSATQTVGSAFGCGEVIDGTGMFLNDRTWWMALDGGPNVVAPFRRANIGHAPTVVMDATRPLVALGSPGGFGIVQYVVQVLVNMLDYGIDLQRAIEVPRFRIEDLGGTVGIEQRVPAETRRALSTMGHDIVDYPAWTDRVGGVEGVYIHPTENVLLGGYDPRRNSLAAGLA